MKPLASFPQCLDCIREMARTASETAAGSDKALGAVTRRRAMEVLEKAHKQGLSSPEVANLVMREIAGITGVKDPYEEFKKREMAVARRVYGQTAQFKSKDINWLLSFAVLSNSLDSFMEPDEALSVVEKQARKPVDFYRDDSAVFKSALAQKPKLMLYLTDNAGEIYFDLPLYDYLRTKAQRLVLVVKGGPGLNDLTRADLDREGLSQRFEDVADTGTDGAGIDWQRVSPKFMDLLSRAGSDSGQGHGQFRDHVRPRIGLPGVIFVQTQVQAHARLSGRAAGQLLRPLAKRQKRFQFLPRYSLTGLDAQGLKNIPADRLNAARRDEKAIKSKLKA